VELVRQIEVNIDYILLLVKQYHEKHCKDMEILVRIKKAMASSLELRSKRELVEQFVSTLNEGNDDIYQLWRAFVQEQREQQLTTLIQEERLNDEKTRVFVNNAFAAGTLKTTGTDIDGIMPPMSRFGGSNREEKKKTLIDKLKAFFERFSGLGGE
jgi:type I restriction enzyme R subunit